MNLYELRFRHYAPKGAVSGLRGYLIAENEELVFEYIKSTSYAFRAYDEDGEEREEDSLEYQSYRQRIIEAKGSMYDEDSLAELSDLYYGATLYGWKFIKEVNSFLGLFAKLKTYGINVEGVFYKEDGSLGILSKEE